MARKRITEKSVVVSAGAAAAPVRRKTSTSNRRTRTTSVSGTPEAFTLQAPVAPVAQTVSRTVPTYEEIASLAYSYWEARCHQGGSSEDDWFRAERELSAK